MPLSRKTPRALAAIFESPSDDEDFLGFGVAPPAVDSSEDSRDSLCSGDSGKPVLCFRSKFMTSELTRLFTESDSEGADFEGFKEEDDDDDEDEEEKEEEEGRLTGRKKTLSVVSEEESDEDTGFYSEGEESAPPRKRSLCVAFRFPVKRLSAQKKEEPEKPQPIAAAPPERRTSQRMRQKRDEAQVCSGRGQRGGAEKKPPQREEVKKKKEEEVEEEEDEDEEEEEEKMMLEVKSQVLSKRDKNIQENKAMLAKLFADLSSMAELTPLSTPPKKRRVSEKPSPRKRGSEGVEGGERRNPSRKARPPEKFGVEERSVSPSRLAKHIRTMDVRRLMEVDDDMREEGRGGKKRRSDRGKQRRKSEVRSVDDITQDELDNVAERSKDKILDKDHGSTCHQCRQKTLDTKTVCRNPYCLGVKGQFCGPCLRNRYGEDVRSALLDPTWECPLCRGLCNCSICRKRDGRCATGNLVSLAKHNGYSNVQEYLESIQKQLASTG